MDTKSVINNEYDYSNILPTIEYIDYLVKYCDNAYNQLNKLVEEDEEKNKKFKPEYKEFNYAHSYGAKFEVFIREKSYNNITCKDYNTFVTAVKDGNLNEIMELEIKVDLDFRRGIGNNLEDYENSFTIIFKPYDIKFARKSNHNEPNMNQLEDQINTILKQFPVANCVFCNKNN